MPEQPLLAGVARRALASTGNGSTLKQGLHHPGLTLVPPRAARTTAFRSPDCAIVPSPDPFVPILPMPDLPIESSRPYTQEEVIEVLRDAITNVKKRKAAGKKAKPKRSKSGPVYLTEQEIEKLLGLAASRCIRNWVLILLTYRHGLRRAEALNIRRRDIEGGFLSVQRGKDSDKTEQALKPHRNPLLDEVKAVEGWLDSMEKCGKKGGAKPGGRRSRYETSQSTQKGKFCTENPLPSAPEGKQKLFSITPRRFHQIFRAYATEIGLPPSKRHPHVLKHSIVIHLLKHRVPINEVIAWVGWKSIKTADHYTKVKADEVARSVDVAMGEAYQEPMQGTLSFA
jgi:integrase